MPEAPVRRTARSVDYGLSDMRVFRIIDKRGRGCNDVVQVANQLQRRSGILGHGGKTGRVRGGKRAFASAVDPPCTMVVKAAHGSLQRRW